MKHSRNLPILLVLCLSVILIQINTVSAAPVVNITRCIGQPVTLNWSSSNVVASGCALTPSTNNPAYCSFNPTPDSNQSKPISLPSGSCTNSLACGTEIRYSTLTIDTTKVWNNHSSSCTGPLSINVDPTNYSATLPNSTISATYTLGSGNSSNTTCRLLDNVGSPLTSYSACTGSMSVTAPAADGAYGYSIQAYKSQTGTTLTSNGFTVTIYPSPTCANGAINYPTCTCSSSQTLIGGICTDSTYGCMTVGANNRNLLANVDDGSCCYGWNNWNGNACVPPPAQITTLIVEPRTSALGTALVLSWSIKYPSAICTLSATTVCAGGHTNCNTSQLVAETMLNQTLQSGTTDSNDIYGASRSMSSAIKTVPPTSSTNALGKKTLQINDTTDFLLQCGASFKKVRFLVGNTHEG